MIKCKNCWWFRKNSSEKSKGQCLVYGLTMDGDSIICCDFDVGDTNE